MASLAFTRQGTGDPLLLVHATGLDRTAWDPVLPQLARTHEVLAIDLPGHGESPPARDHPPNAIGYAQAVAGWLDEIGVERPHVAGNSAGGWAALELAKLARARSVCALAPAGLWPRSDPFSGFAQLWLSYQLTRLARPLVPHVLRRALGRALFMRRMLARPRELTPSQATAIAASLLATDRFVDHLRANHSTRFSGGQAIDVPVTVVWGKDERIVPPRARGRGELPPHVRYVEIDDCGHLMAFDQPDAVATAILETAAAA